MTLSTASGPFIAVSTLWPLLLNSTAKTLDTTGGLVRILVTSLSGVVNVTGLGSLDMAVQRIDREENHFVQFFRYGHIPSHRC